jgi:hypothetical protein
LDGRANHCVQVQSTRTLCLHATPAGNPAARPHLAHDRGLGREPHNVALGDGAEAVVDALKQGDVLAQLAARLGLRRLVDHALKPHTAVEAAVALDQPLFQAALEVAFGWRGGWRRASGGQG